MFEAYNLRGDTVYERAEVLRHKVEGLSSAQRAEYYAHYTKALKDPDTYAALNWLFLAGLHHFYLAHYLQGLLNLSVMIIGIALCFIAPLLGSALILLITLIELPALFRSQLIVEAYNVQLGFDIYRKIAG
jgi:TM2 domain-containing membrane protein YozV